MMLGKLWCMTAAIAVAGVLAMPAAAAPADSGKPKAHHHMGCYDFAWDSQDMKDCLAKHTSAQKPMTHHHHMAKKPT